MPETKHKVESFEVNYVCDKCGYGMMRQIGHSDEEKETAENPHECVICGHQQIFKGVIYPHIIHVDEDEDV